MSKLFLEIIEQLGDKEIEIPKIVKLGVKDRKEAEEKLLDEEPKFVGLNYIKRLHTCYHDEKNNKSCEVSNL